MDHEQWTALQAATKGHTPGPWKHNGWSPPKLWPRHLIDADGAEVNRSGYALAAAAPDLLAEVERLRGWLRVIVDRVSIRSDTLTEKQIKDALNGAEVRE